MNIFTVDVEEWFHLLNHPATREPAQWSRYSKRIDENLDRILALLSETGTPATFFCLGWIAERYPYLVRNIANLGYELACHSHHHQLVYEQTPKQFRADLTRAKAAIADATGVEVDTYRAPGFSLTAECLWMFNILAEEGFHVDCSFSPAARAHGGMPSFMSDRPCIIDLRGIQIFEFPLNVLEIASARLVFSGGGLFRLLPYPLLRRLFAREDYIMTYFHPREFDPDQPNVPDLSLLRRFKSYVGLKDAEKKLANLLKEFNFVDVRGARASIDWSIAKHVHVG